MTSMSPRARSTCFTSVTAERFTGSPLSPRSSPAVNRQGTNPEPISEPGKIQHLNWEIGVTAGHAGFVLYWERRGRLRRFIAIIHHERSCPTTSSLNWVTRGFLDGWRRFRPALFFVLF